MFIHFLHHQTLALYRIPQRLGSRTKLVETLRHALKWALFLSKDTLIVPTSDLVQSPVASEFVEDFELLIAAGVIDFVGSSVNLDIITQNHVEHFQETPLHSMWRSRSVHRRLQEFESGFQLRAINTTFDVAKRWTEDVIDLDGNLHSMSRLSTGQLLQAHRLLPTRVSPKDYEAALAAIPDRLEKHAFLWSVVEDLNLFDYETSPTAREHIEHALAWHWAMSYVEEYRTPLIGRVPGIGYIDCGLRRTNPELLVDLTAYERAMAELGLDLAFRTLTLNEVLGLRNQPGTILFRDNILSPVSDVLTGSTRLPSRQLAVLGRIWDGIRSSVLNASNAYRAMTIASERATEWVLDRSSSMSSNKIDDGSEGASVDSDGRVPVSDFSLRSSASLPTVVIVLALEEELRKVLTTVREVVGSISVIDDAETGMLSYGAMRTLSNQVHLHLVFVLVGRGPEHAAAGTVLAITRHKPCIVVNVGIAGALSADVHIGDVVIGEQIVSYLANAKAVPGTEGSFEFVPAGEHLRSDRYLVDRARQLEFSCPDALADAKEMVRQIAVRSNVGFTGPNHFRVFTGAIASGHVVGAAAAFKDWIRRWKRDYLAIEQEASGVAVAAELAGMIRRVRFLALRGISDGADEGKAQLEHDTNGAARTVAVAAALHMLLVLLDTLPPETYVRVPETQ